MQVTSPSAIAELGAIVAAHNSTALPTQAEYLLEIVNQEMAALQAEREQLDDSFFEQSNWPKRDQNHGAILALAGIQGRLLGMIQVQSWGRTNLLWRS